MRLTWQTTVDGAEERWNRTIQPGVEWTIWEANPAFIQYNEAHRSTVTWNVSWSMTASHELGPVTVLHEGAFAFTPPVVDDERQSSADDAPEGTFRDALDFVLIVGLVVFLGIGSLMLTLRVAARQAEERGDDDEPEQPTLVSETMETPSAQDPEALAYHANLIEQGYSDEDAATYTRKYFPEF